MAAGVIQNVTSSEVANVINEALTNKTHTKAELSTFAAAPVGAGNLAGDVVARVVELANVVAPTDVTVRKNIGIAALKAIAVTAPDAGRVIAGKLIDASGILFNDDLKKSDLAKALAKGVPASAPTAGFAVARVAQKLASQTPADLAALGAGARDRRNFQRKGRTLRDRGTDRCRCGDPEFLRIRRRGSARAGIGGR